jgi:VWFA-related protein
MLASFAAAWPGTPSMAQNTPTLQTPAQTPTQQTPAPQQSGSTAASRTAKEVNLLAVVRDKKGEPINGLEKDDFILQQDGHPQTITQFAHDTALPLTVGVVADTAPGSRQALDAERKAGKAFLDRLLRQGTDHGFVLHFDKEVELLQDVTESHDKLDKGMDAISAGEAERGHGRGGEGDDPTHPHYFFGGNQLYDAIFLAADEVLHGQQGRKAIVLFTDGVDRESKSSLYKAIEAAQRAEMLVYCVWVAPEREEQPENARRGIPTGMPGGYPGGGYPGGGYPGSPGSYPGGGGPFPRRREPETPRENKTDGKKILQQIASESGGRYFELGHKKAEEIFAQIEAELRHQYSLSYTPDEAGSGFHKLQLSTRKSETTVQTQAGFYAE